jgi:hypothetical protein
MLRTFAIGLIAAAAFSACDREGTQGDIQDAPRANQNEPLTQADTRVDIVATAEPGSSRRQWRADTETTRRIAGNLTASIDGPRGAPIVLAFATGITIRAERIGEKVGGDRAGHDNLTFSAVLQTDPNAGVYLYRTLEERVAITAEGGLCGGDRTTHIVISEFVNRAGDWVFRAAAYKGAAAPGASGAQYCATYGFRVR